MCPNFQNQNNGGAESSCNSTPDPLEYLTTDLELTPLSPRDEEYNDVFIHFLNGVVPYLGRDGVDVLAVHKNTMHGGFSKACKLVTFELFKQAVGNKCGGNAKVERCWYGGSKEQLSRVLSFGFSGCSVPVGGMKHGHGVGVYLSPLTSPINYVESSVPDENGIRYMLLCRVILGKLEKIAAGSSQSLPSSEEFDSGVDNPVTPGRYIVWCANMNTHILPEFLISFQAPSPTGWKRVPIRTRGPSSPSISFPALFSMLSKYVDPSDMDSISKARDDFCRNKITRSQLVQNIRRVVGDDLLKFIIKSCSQQIRAKKPSRSGAVPKAVTEDGTGVTKQLILAPSIEVLDNEPSLSLNKKVFDSLNCIH